MADAQMTAVMALNASAALAELGYAPLTTRVVHKYGDEYKARFSWMPANLPPIEIRWKAWVVAGCDTVACLACYRWARPTNCGPVRRSPCTERGLGTLDCGADRA